MSEIREVKGYLIDESVIDAVVDALNASISISLLHGTNAHGKILSAATALDDAINLGLQVVTLRQVPSLKPTTPVPNPSTD